MFTIIKTCILRWNETVIFRAIFHHLLSSIQYPIIWNHKKYLKYMEIQTQAVENFNMAGVEVPAET